MKKIIFTFIFSLITIFSFGQAYGQTSVDTAYNYDDYTSYYSTDSECSSAKAETSDSVILYYVLLLVAYSIFTVLYSGCILNTIIKTKNIKNAYPIWTAFLLGPIISILYYGFLPNDSDTNMNEHTSI